MILEFASKPNAVILAVTPANQDLVNSEALKLAREADHEGFECVWPLNLLRIGKRTLGVLTKLDLMDAGTNAYDILTGRAFPLKLGFIGIVNRSQQDIIDRRSLEDSLKNEEEFFRHHTVYRGISHRCGTPFLSRTLNTVGDGGLWGFTRVDSATHESHSKLPARDQIAAEFVDCSNRPGSLIPFCDAIVLL